MHGPPQVLADDGIRVADAGERTPDCLADGDTGALTIVGERARPASQPGCTRKLRRNPVMLGARTGGPVAPGDVECVRGLELTDLGAQPHELAAVLADRAPIQNWLRRACSQPAGHGQPGGQICCRDVLARIRDQDGEVRHADAVLHQDAAVSEGHPPVAACPRAVGDLAAVLRAGQAGTGRARAGRVRTVRTGKAGGSGLAAGCP